MSPLARWIRERLQPFSERRCGLRRKLRMRPLVAERLEERAMLAVFTVTNTNDAGAGSLRDAVAKANAQADADSIVFDASLANKTIVLTSDETNPAVAKQNSNASNAAQIVYGRTALAITSDVTIDGAAAAGLQLSGKDERRLFVIAGPNAL